MRPYQTAILVALSSFFVAFAAHAIQGYLRSSSPLPDRYIEAVRGLQNAQHTYNDVVQEWSQVCTAQKLVLGRDNLGEPACVSPQDTPPTLAQPVK